MTSRPSTAAPILTVLAIVLVTLGAYVGGYFWLGKKQEAARTICRLYPYQWQTAMFKPAGWIEKKLRGKGVYLAYERQPSP